MYLNTGIKKLEGDRKMLREEEGLIQEGRNKQGRKEEEAGGREERDLVTWGAEGAGTPLGILGAISVRDKSPDSSSHQPLSTVSAKQEKGL